MNSTISIFTNPFIRGLYLGLVTAFAVMFLELSASAEPYFAVRDGYKCSTCHVNKTGGGKRTKFALIYMQSRMSMDLFSRNGRANDPDGIAGHDARGPASGDFVHGWLNEKFSVGADVRVNYHADFPVRGETDHGFGRESKCVSCHTSLNGGGKRGEIYFQADLIPQFASIYVAQNLLPGMDSREAFALFQNKTLNSYVKAGVFRLPAGLRRVYDDPFPHGIAGDTSFLAQRASGVEAGVEPGAYSAIVSVTNAGTPTAPGDTNEKRLAIQGSAIFKNTLAGVSHMMDPIDEDNVRWQTSLFAGVNLGRFSGLFQIDRIASLQLTDNTEIRQRLGLLEIDYLISKGQNLKLAYEYHDPDTDTGGDIVDRNSLIYEPFLAPFVQIRVGVRDASGPTGDTETNFHKWFAQLHLFF